ncbi:MAG: GNAT family N-acetyltransferase [Xanthomonadales bacterium]|nr:GNAT family N-acetyltransferase [Xanthomonadales bacterium]
MWRRKTRKIATATSAVEKTSLRVVESNRMVLVAANADLVRADLEGVVPLGDMLEAQVPENWPPELYDREAMEYALRMLDDTTVPGWSFWYLLKRSEQPPQLLGICGFKGRPDAAGSAEIGYSIISQFRNQGFASEAVDRLVRWAFSHQIVHEVSAETLPHLPSSIRVMKKNGFEFVGAGSERGVVRYAVQRPDRR